MEEQNDSQTTSNEAGTCGSFETLHVELNL